jgi:outer membrane protein OmpA-like peptidoglycan-associated protein
MSRHARSAAIAATFIVVPSIASAQLNPVAPLEGLYVGAGAGVNWLQDQHVSNSLGTAGSGSLGSKAGFIGLASIGYALPNGVRFEIEGDFRRDQFTTGENLDSPSGASGSERKVAAMFNVLYDFSHLVQVPWFSPYAGVGVGYGWSHLDNFALYNAATGVPSLASSGTQGAIAYQAIIGGAFALPVRGLALTAEYRFFGMGSRNYDVTSVSTAGGASETGEVKLGNEFNHAILIGIRYNFNEPLPPQAPASIGAPAQVPARSYLVFFDWDQATLTDRARQIIKDAADNSTRVQFTRIEVNGYTDTSGTQQYNQTLSVRRARAVQGELIRDGVAEQVITIQGFGDTNLLIPTGVGVREPQNRRVEIIIH